MWAQVKVFIMDKLLTDTKLMLLIHLCQFQHMLGRYRELFFLILS